MTLVPRSFLAAALAAGLSLLVPAQGQAQAANAGASCPPAAIPLSPERFEAGMRQAQDHGFLWRLTKDGRTSYLYGTLHAAQPAWMFPGPRTAAAFPTPRTLWSEERCLTVRLTSPSRSTGRQQRSRTTERGKPRSTSAAAPRPRP